MVYIPGGTFMMGSEKQFLMQLKKKDEMDETPIHRVTLLPFCIGKYAVTQAQWHEVMGSNLSSSQSDDLPMECISWEHAAAFCVKLSNQTGKSYRLPTEAEWEYACRAGSTGKWCFGNNENLLEQYAWYYENSGGKTHPVGQKLPNQFGLYDMHGNVYEWCQDWYDRRFYRNSPLQNPLGPAKSEVSLRMSNWRVMRGGSYGTTAEGCRSARRLAQPSDVSKDLMGCRVVCTANT